MKRVKTPVNQRACRNMRNTTVSLSCACSRKCDVTAKSQGRAILVHSEHWIRRGAGRPATPSLPLKHDAGEGQIMTRRLPMGSEACGKMDIRRRSRFRARPGRPDLFFEDKSRFDKQLASPNKPIQAWSTFGQQWQARGRNDRFWQILVDRSASCRRILKTCWLCRDASEVAMYQWSEWPRWVDSSLKIAAPSAEIGV